MAIAAFEDHAPDVPHVTAYDERHHRTYWRLLDAAEERADWRDAVRIIFGIDAACEPDRARAIYDTHLARARWMTQAGYRHYLTPPPAAPGPDVGRNGSENPDKPLT